MVAVLVHGRPCDNKYDGGMMILIVLQQNETIACRSFETSSTLSAIVGILFECWQCHTPAKFLSPRGLKSIHIVSGSVFALSHMFAAAAAAGYCSTSAGTIVA